MSKKPRFSPAIKKQTLAEQVAEAIKESILAGEWQGGEALPTEPELSDQFGVSRAVVRDATRMLAAQGLVEARHGKGVFVTNSQVDAFGDALLLALRRAQATVWDVEQFEQLLYPEVCALAAREATAAELETIRQTADAYLQLFEQITRQNGEGTSMSLPQQTQVLAASRQFTQAVFSATHNQLLTLLAQPLLRLRNLRDWEARATVEQIIEMERTYFRTLVEALATRDPEYVRTTVAAMMQLPPEAETAMRETAVGEIPNISGNVLPL